MGRATFQVTACALEPFDLVSLEPVVAAELALVGGVAVGVEEPECESGVGGASSGEYFDVVVADAVDGCGAEFGE